MSKLLFYPTLESRGINVINYEKSENFEFYFTNNDDEELFILVDVDSKPVVMNDKNRRWYHTIHNLIISRKLTIDTRGLFGVEGIAPIDSKIGIALIYSSIDSLQRDTLFIGEISSNDEEKSFDIKYELPKNSYRNKLNFSIELFLLEESNDDLTEERHLANLKGTMLGIVDNIQLITQGQSSVFPTKLIESKSDPLWKLHSSSILENNFNEHVALYINKSHKDYSLFDPESERYNIDFITEVMINIVFILIVKCIDRFDELDDDNFDEGTIGSMLCYYKKAFSITNSDLEEIYSSISLGVRR